MHEFIRESSKFPPQLFCFFKFLKFDMGNPYCNPGATTVLTSTNTDFSLNSGYDLKNNQSRSFHAELHFGRNLQPQLHEASNAILPGPPRGPGLKPCTPHWGHPPSTRLRLSVSKALQQRFAFAQLSVSWCFGADPKGDDWWLMFSNLRGNWTSNVVPLVVPSSFFSLVGELYFVYLNIIHDSLL